MCGAWRKRSNPAWPGHRSPDWHVGPLPLPPSSLCRNKRCHSHGPGVEPRLARLDSLHDRYTPASPWPAANSRILIRRSEPSQRPRPVPMHRPAAPARTICLFESRCMFDMPTLQAASRARIRARGAVRWRAPCGGLALPPTCAGLGRARKSSTRTLGTPQLIGKWGSEVQPKPALQCSPVCAADQASGTARLREGCWGRGTGRSCVRRRLPRHPGRDTAVCSRGVGRHLNRTHSSQRSTCRTGAVLCAVRLLRNAPTGGQQGNQSALACAGQ